MGSIVAKPSGAKSVDPGFTDVDKRVFGTTMKIWANFARTGNPSVKGLIEWPAWDRTTGEYLLITDPLQIRGGYSDLAKIVPDSSQQMIQ